MATNNTIRPRGRNGSARPTWADTHAPAAGSPPGPCRPPSAAPPESSPPDPRIHDPVTAAHDAIDFARALVADGGVSTAGLTMMRGEVQQLARQVAAMRAELAATRQDCDRVRLDLLRLSQFTHGLLVDRLATRFHDIDRRLAGLAGVHAFNSGPDFAPGS
jgi:hypothetical protein